MIGSIAYLMAFSLVFSTLAIYISIINWKRWKSMDLDTMKARAFLDRSFVDYNFKLTLVTVIIVGGFMGMHVIMEYLELSIKTSGLFYIIYYSLLPIASAILMIMAYMWYKLINMKQKKE